MKQELTELKNLSEKTTLSKYDKRRIEELSIEFNVDFPITNCQEKYKEQILILLNILDPKPKQETTFELRDTIDIIWKGKRVNTHTITTEIAEDLIESGLIGLFKKT